MKTTVDDLLSLRAHDPTGLNRMVTWSLSVHVIAVVLLALAPKLGWFARKPPPHMLVITLGGGQGPQAGPTTIGGRPVDEVAPPLKRPEPIKPVATKPDVMTVPEKAIPAPKKEPPAPPKKEEQAKAPAKAATPVSTGRQITPGNSRAETGVTGLGTGLQLGGGGVGGATTLDDFCCKAYLAEVQRRIQANWDARQEIRGNAIVQFTVHRNGSVSDVEVVQSTHFLLQQASRRPFLTLRLPPLPSEYTLETITLRMPFEYQ